MPPGAFTNDICYLLREDPRRDTCRVRDSARVMQLSCFKRLSVALSHASVLRGMRVEYRQYRSITLCAWAI